MAQDKIETEVLIQYIIDGILDNTQSKLILFGTKNLRNFKEN